jgi:uracil-DNA glycosylase
MNETVEEVEIEKRTYSPQYVDAMFESVKQYLPPGVWEKLHQQVMPKAGGMAAAENRRAAAQEAQTAAEGAVESAQAAATQQDVNAEQGIGKQDLPSGMNNTDQASPSSQGCPDCPPCPPCQQSGSGPETPPDTTVQQSQKSVEKAGGCQGVVDNCMKLKEKAGETGSEAEKDCEKTRNACQNMSKEDVDKTAHGKQDAPIADTGAWDAGAAQKRMVAAATNADGDINFSQLKRGYLWSAPNPSKLSDFKFPVGDIINGQFKINRTALAAAAGRINQSKGIPPDELASMKTTLRSYYKDIGEDAPDNIQKLDVETYIGPRAQVLFIAASPSPNDTIRKSAMTGKPGRIFDERYLKPLNLTRNDIAFMYLVPHLRKHDNGTPREPNTDEIEKWSDWFDTELNRIEKGHKMVRVALGHTVKKSLGRDIDFTLPHPILLELGVPRAEQEFQRKRLMLAKSLEARYQKN